MKKVFKAFLTLSLFSSLLTGCTSKRVKIAYTIYPVGYLVYRVAGKDVQYQSIQKDNATVQTSTIADDYQDILDTSKVLFHIGDLEPYYAVHHADIKNNGITDIDLSSNNAVYPFARFTQKESDEGITYEQSNYYDGQIFSSIDTYDKELCLWMDPITMLSMASDIKDYLVRSDSGNSKKYEDNFQTLESDLINIDAQYHNLAIDLEKNDQVIRFVSVTSSFGSWQKAYGFEVYPLMLSKYGVLPNEQQIQAIEERIMNDNVHFIAYEANMNEDMIDLYNRVKEDCNLTRIDLSNLSSLSDDESNAGKDYISIFYQNLQNLQTIIEDRNVEGQ